MSDPIHPARQMRFAALMAGLDHARALGFVQRRLNAAAGLHLFVYTTRCVYEDAWDDFTLIARGLVVDAEHGRIVHAVP